MIQPAIWGTVHDDAVAGWVVVGPLVYALIGVLVGAYVSSRNQRKQWIEDNKKQEYRELQTALINAVSAVLDRKHVLKAGDAERFEEITQAYFLSLNTLKDRIYIAREVKEEGFFELWAAAVTQYLKDGNGSEVEKTANFIMERIVKLATKGS